MHRLMILALGVAMAAGLAACERNSGGSPGYSAPPSAPVTALR